MEIEKDSNREAFESWFESRYDAHFMQFALDLDMYVDKHTQTSWEAWQAAKAQEVQQWISVQDRMPEQGQKVLVFRPDAHNHPHKDPNFKICTYAGADIFINSHFEHVITHWKPLESPIEAQEPAND